MLNESSRCVNECSEENAYNYSNTCFKTCPTNTFLVNSTCFDNEISSFMNLFNNMPTKTILIIIISLLCGVIIIIGVGCLLYFKVFRKKSGN